MTILNGFTHDIPNGGNAGQLLAKNTDSDYDTKWIDPPSGGNGDKNYLVKAPVGTIVIWSGTADNIPTGWALCDGEDGRPDLRDRFVLGAGTSHAVGEMGGAEEVTLTVEQMPSHTHRQKSAWSTSNQNNQGPYSVSVPDTGDTGSTGGDKPHPNMPPYYTLCYIIKISPDETDGVTMEQVNEAINLAISGAIEEAY